MSNFGVEIEEWDIFKTFAFDYGLPIYKIEYPNKYDVFVHLDGVRYFYTMLKRWDVEVADLLSIPEEPGPGAP